MSWTDGIHGRRRLYRVRPKFLAACAVVVLMLLLPDVVAQSFVLKGIALLFATFCVMYGWLLRFKDPTPNKDWRSPVALIASLYLAVSLPVFFFEMSQIKWLMRNPWHSWFSAYVRPWVHWGYALILLGVVCSFAGRGRARIAFGTASILLLVLRASMGTWVF